jgi:HK97 family phage major capsid protein/HK97 family phage prohead protease
MLNRAYSLLEIKRVDEAARLITGMATTPTPDRLQDVIEPEGAQFKLPLPFLWQHDSAQPIGHVTKAKVTPAGIEIVAKIAKGVTAEIDRAWSLIKAGLVQGLSIGFKAIEVSHIKDGGIRFIKYDWLELSAVTIPANAEATIATVKSIDTAQRAAPGQTAPRHVVHLTPPGAAGRSKQSAQEGATMKSIAEQITALEAKRMASAARMEAIMQKTLDEERTTNAEEQDDFDKLSGDVEAIDKDLVRLRAVEKAKAITAKPVIKAEMMSESAEQRGGSIIVKTQPKLEPGIEFARRVKVAVLAQKTRYREDQIAESMYGNDSEVAQYFKTAVPAGTTISPNWAANLVAVEAAGPGGFLEYLRPATILGRFGAGGIPALNTVGWRQPLISQTAGGAAWWVGQGAAKPVTKFDFARDKLEPTKLASICVLTMESIRDSSPKSDVIVRDQLRAVISAEQDKAFIDPANAGTANIKPASITNAAETIASSGDDEAAVRLDVRSLIAKFTAANNPPSAGVWIMNSASASGLGTMLNPLGQPSFPGMTNFSGGTFFMMPVIVSDHVGDIAVLANARDIFLAQDDGIQVDASDQVSLQMDDAPTNNSATPTGTSLVSMWQTNSVAFRAEHAIGWRRGRLSAVAYLTGVSWGGEVNTA